MLRYEKPANQLLAALTQKDYKSLSRKLVRVPLVFEEVIYEPGDVIRDVYFPESGIISLLSAVDNEATLEVGIVGNEGMAGLPLFLGIKNSSNRALVQGSGSAIKLSAQNFRTACRESGQLSEAVGRFVHSLFTQISQSAVCNRYHRIEPRLARWLLMTHDRMQTDEFRITQEFLSNMLGVRREAVNKAAGDLQRQEAISYHRGTLNIKDRNKLKRIACSCYATIRRSYDGSE